MEEGEGEGEGKGGVTAVDWGGWGEAVLDPLSVDCPPGHRRALRHGYLVCEPLRATFANMTEDQLCSTGIGRGQGGGGMCVWGRWGGGGYVCVVNVCGEGMCVCDTLCVCVCLFLCRVCVCM